jgi:hypothetical protein
MNLRLVSSKKINVLFFFGPKKYLFLNKIIFLLFLRFIENVLSMVAQLHCCRYGPFWYDPIVCIPTSNGVCVVTQCYIVDMDNLIKF